MGGGRPVSLTLPVATSATTDRHSAAAGALFRSNDNVNSPGWRANTSLAARRATPRRRYLRTTKNSATSSTSTTACVIDAGRDPRPIQEAAAGVTDRTPSNSSIAATAKAAAFPSP